MLFNKTFYGLHDGDGCFRLRITGAVEDRSFMLRTNQKGGA